MVTGEDGHERGLLQLKVKRSLLLRMLENASEEVANGFSLNMIG